jgi:hypothetical protein
MKIAPHQRSMLMLGTTQGQIPSVVTQEEIKASTGRPMLAFNKIHLQIPKP